jgi:uncharacterized protein (UPF0248 family)
MAYSILNKLKWTKKLEECEVVILHRGAENNKKAISGSSITEIKKSHFYYKNGKIETFIPMHRVLEIRLKGEIIWQKRKKEM